MDTFITVKWSEAIFQQPYFDYHFLNHQYDLVQNLLNVLKNDCFQTLECFLTQLANTTQNSQLTFEELLDSFFKLRDLFIDTSSLSFLVFSREQINHFQKRTEQIIAHLSCIKEQSQSKKTFQFSDRPVSEDLLPLSQLNTPARYAPKKLPAAALPVSKEAAFIQSFSQEIQAPSPKTDFQQTQSLPLASVSDSEAPPFSQSSAASAPFCLQHAAEQIINNLEHYIFVTDNRSLIHFWNQALEKDLQIPAAQAIGQTLFELLPEFEVFNEVKSFSRILKQGKSFTKKLFLHLGNAQKRCYHLSIIPQLNDGSSALLLWVIQDIHDEELRKEKITWQNNRLMFLQNLSTLLNATPDLHQTLQRFSEELGRIFSFESLSILFPVDPHKKYFRIYFSSGKPLADTGQAFILNLAKSPIYSHVVKKKQKKLFSLKAHEFLSDPYLTSLKQNDIQALVCFPIIFTGEIIGILTISYREYHQYSQADLAFLEQINNHLTAAMKNCIQFDQIEKQNQKLNFIQKLFVRVRTNQSSEFILNNTLADLASIFHYSQLAIYKVVNEQRWQLVSEYTPGNHSMVTFPKVLKPDASSSLLPQLWIRGFPETPILKLLTHRRTTSTSPNSFICLKEKSSFQGELVLLGLSANYLPDLSYSYHIHIMESILRELALALDHVSLFYKTVQAEKQWETTFNEVQIGLAAVDENFLITRANKSFWKIFQMEAPPIDEPVPCETLFEETMTSTNINQYPTAASLGNTAVVEWQDPISNKYLIRRFFPLPTSRGTFMGGIFTIQDVTDERLKEEHIRYLSRFPEVNPNIVLSLSKEGEVIYINAAAKKLLRNLGISPLNSETLIPVTLSFELKKGQFTANVPHKYIHNLNDQIFQFSAFMPEAHDNIYLYGIEITERLELQKKLIQTERVRAIGEMAAGVAHDFNNLLATILGRAQLISLKAPDPLTAQEVQIIEKAAKDGAEIVKRMQDLTPRKTEKSLRDVYLKDLIQDSLLYSAQKLKLGTQVKGKKIHIHKELDSQLIVRGNPIELKEIFTNLIFNAYDAMPNDGELFIKTTARDPQTARIHIRDTGTGIPSRIKTKIFDPFFTTKGERGTGLGLSLVYNIVTAHKGNIQVESQPGKGTEFIIELPLSTQKPTSAQQRPKKLPKLTQLGDINMLVVDDEPELLETITEVLKLKFKRVDMANSGKEALKKIQDTTYDIILTDLGMPEISGWELAKKVKKKLPDSKVVLVTGWGMQAEAELKNHKYVDKIISKPYDLHHLLLLLEQMNLNN